MNLSSWGMIRLIDFNKMIPSRQLHSVKPLGVVKNYRKLWLVVDQQKHGRKPRTEGIEISSLMRLIVWSRGRPGRLAIRKENRFYIRYGMEKDLTSISSVGEKESFLVDCREALLGLKLKGLARRQNSFLSGHKQAQKNRIIAQKQGREGFRTCNG